MRRIVLHTLVSLVLGATAVGCAAPSNSASNDDESSKTVSITGGKNGSLGEYGDADSSEGDNSANLFVGGDTLIIDADGIDSTNDLHSHDGGAGPLGGFTVMVTMSGVNENFETLVGNDTISDESGSFSIVALDGNNNVIGSRIDTPETEDESSDSSGGSSSLSLISARTSGSDSPEDLRIIINKSFKDESHFDNSQAYHNQFLISLVIVRNPERDLKNPEKVTVGDETTIEQILTFSTVDPVSARVATYPVLNFAGLKAHRKGTQQINLSFDASTPSEYFDPLNSPQMMRIDGDPIRQIDADERAIDQLINDDGDDARVAYYPERDNVRIIDGGMDIDYLRWTSLVVSAMGRLLSQYHQSDSAYMVSDAFSIFYETSKLNSGPYSEVLQSANALPYICEATKDEATGQLIAKSIAYVAGYRSSTFPVRILNQVTTNPYDPYDFSYTLSVPDTSSCP